MCASRCSLCKAFRTVTAFILTGVTSVVVDLLPGFLCGYADAVGNTVLARAPDCSFRFLLLVWADLVVGDTLEVPSPGSPDRVVTDPHAQYSGSDAPGADVQAVTDIAPPLPHPPRPTIVQVPALKMCIPWNPAGNQTHPCLMARHCTTTTCHAE